MADLNPRSAAMIRCPATHSILAKAEPRRWLKWGLIKSVESSYLSVGQAVVWCVSDNSTQIN